MAFGTVRSCSSRWVTSWAFATCVVAVVRPRSVGFGDERYHGVTTRLGGLVGELGLLIHRSGYGAVVAPIRVHDSFRIPEILNGDLCNEGHLMLALHA